MEALLSELKDLGSKEFAIQMCDHLSQEDYDDLRKIHTREREIKEQLEREYGYKA